MKSGRLLAVGTVEELKAAVGTNDFEAAFVSIGERGLLLVDVGDEIIGPHRILLSLVESVTASPDEEFITIRTEHSIYKLERID